MAENKNKRIDYAEFQELLGRIKFDSILEHGDHANTFIGVIDGQRVSIKFNFQSETGSLSYLDQEH